MDDHSPSRENFLDVLLETRKRIDTSAKRDQLTNDDLIIDPRHRGVAHVPQCATEDRAAVTVQGLQRGTVLEEEARDVHVAVRHREMEGGRVVVLATGIDALPEHELDDLPAPPCCRPGERVSEMDPRITRKSWPAHPRQRTVGPELAPV